MKRQIVLPICLLIGIAHESPAQGEVGTSSPESEGRPLPAVAVWRTDEHGNPRYGARVITTGWNEDDPGYELYKTGYSMVLAEEWNGAIDTFERLLSAYPASGYCDDASYWRAYVLVRNNSLPDAIENYHLFVQSFPESPYFDDAVADLTEAETRLELSELKIQLDELESMKNQQDAMKHYTRALNLERQLQLGAWNQARVDRGFDEEPIDAETQIRMEALNILSDNPDDEEAANSLKDVALNTENPTLLRVEAVHRLSRFESEISRPVFVQIAKMDENENLRMVSIEHLAETREPASVAALIDIFNHIPSAETEVTARVFYAIADAGTDEAVDFMATVAREHSDMTLRREAIYYLGAVGTDRARTALHSILRGPR